MSAQIESLIGEILEREGGFVDHADDRGGPTNMGITLATLREWRGRETSAEDVRLLSEDEARAIYRDRYVVRPGFAAVPEPLRSLLVDSGVNHGTVRASRWLQEALAVTVDGIVGPETEGALAVCDLPRIYRKVLAARIRGYGRIITDNP